MSADDRVTSLGSSITLSVWALVALMIALPIWRIWRARRRAAAQSVGRSLTESGSARSLNRPGACHAYRHSR
ncbi:hypothetical protein DNK06_17360 [Pseudomonas daroniae]|uniref:Uncharacterized protein n=1 Tax=Phytopseudomonas daroniae TaxID=2487519 RepID=A0A4Q9QIE1_9GAMM|nr:hypothetical protein DNK06_17360 [Pseudomonas daroniae]TBU80528.1 hypothetical protein DNK31_16135 [Pseudomonas sp. FRB 228]TBU89647.1 hypothetical protein DNJ99_16060 [Pseudomonas daroniae]